MTDKIKAKVLSYRDMYHGIFCGRAKVKILEGEDKGKKIELPVVERYKKHEVIELNKRTKD